ncbi:N-alpha-acetyltransferase 30 [Mactra antiquata]
MTDCETTEQYLNHSDSEKINKMSYPTHSVTRADGDADIKHKIPEKCPPNGMNHISPDANGLIVHNTERTLTQINNVGGFSDTQNEDSEKGKITLCDSVENICDCNKSMGENVCELSSNLESVNLNSEERDVFNGIDYVVYESELQMPDIMRLITKDLSEPYSIYTYRYFIHNWPKLCFLAMDAEKCVGAIVCKLDLHKKMVRRGYIAMLAVDSEYRRKQIGSHLVLKAIKAMIADDCDEVVLETEITNQAALRLYENLGFVRDKRLFRYYLNGVDALRLKLWLR